MSKDFDRGGKFFMVLKVGGDAPKMRHASYQLAAAEAKRLAGLNPNTDFIVLEAKEIHMARVVPTYYTEVLS